MLLFSMILAACEKAKKQHDLGFEQHDSGSQEYTRMSMITKTQIYKNTKMLMKWVAVARKSSLTIAFCTIFRGASHGDVRFGQNPYF